jgi:hypothetical protein
MFGLSCKLGAIGCKSVGAGVLSLVLWAGTSASASAEVIITGTPDQVRVEATNATLEELLSGLGDKFGLSYRIGKSLDDKIEGTYTGSLTSVVRRLVRNYDFVISGKFNGEKSALVVLVLGESGSSAIVSARVAPTSPTTTQPTPGDLLRLQVRALLAPR